MNIIASTSNPDLPSWRIRCEQVIPYLKAYDIQLETIHLEDLTRCSLGTLRKLRRAHILIHYKTLLTGKQLRCLKFIHRPMVYDFDDLVSHDVSGELNPTSDYRFKRILRSADAVICGNDFLRATVPTQLPAAVLPSPVPTTGPMSSRHSQTLGPTRLGWVGLKENLPFLETIAAPLRTVAQTFDIELVVLSNAPYDLDGITVTNIPWSLDEQESVIASFDIGLMPLPVESEYSKGKCSYKILQYLAAGVPAVATNLGMNAELLRQGGGLLATDHASWVMALQELLSQSNSREQLGQRGRRLVEEKYSYEVYARSMAHFLKDLV